MKQGNFRETSSSSLSYCQP